MLVLLFRLVVFETFRDAQRPTGPGADRPHTVTPSDLGPVWFYKFSGVSGFPRPPCCLFCISEVPKRTIQIIIEHRTRLRILPGDVFDFFDLPALERKAQV